MYSQKTLQLIDCNSQDCRDLHSWGPGMRQCYVLHYVASGSGYLECGRKCFPVKTHQSFLIYPYTTIRYYPDPDDPWEYYWVNFIGDQSPEYLSSWNVSPEEPALPVIAPDKILPLFHRIQDLDWRRGNYAEANGLLQAILGIYADCFPAAADVPSHGDRFAAVLMLIHSYAHKADFQLELLCRELHVSRATLYRLFKERTGLSPREYILSYRLEQARTMLEKGLSVKSAGISCGFSDQFYFSKAFKEHFGMPPSAYRQTAN